MARKEIAKLNVTMEQIKSSMSRINRFLMEHEDEPLSGLLFNQLNIRKESLDNSFEKFQSTQIQLLLLDPEAIDRSEEIELFYFDICAKINARTSKRSSEGSSANSNVNVVNTSSNASASNINSSSISNTMLPDIDIPTLF